MKIRRIGDYVWYRHPGTKEATPGIISGFLQCSPRMLGQLSGFYPAKDFPGVGELCVVGIIDEEPQYPYVLWVLQTAILDVDLGQELYALARENSKKFQEIVKKYGVGGQL